MRYPVYRYSAYSKKDAEAVRGYRFADTDVPLQQYDGEFDFFIQQAALRVPKGGCVLELAAGSGRIMEGLATAEELAEKEIHIYGIEASESMLFRARRAFSRLPEAVRRKLHLIRGDMCAFALQPVFHLMLVPFNSFWFNFGRYEDSLRKKFPYLNPTSFPCFLAVAEQCLSCMLDALSERGTFIIDKPVYPFVIGDGNEWWKLMAAKHGFDYVMQFPYSKNDIFVDVLVGTKKKT